MSELEHDLSKRLRQVLAERPTTEAELRSLAERALRLERTLAADLEAHERRLDALSAEPGSSVAEAAAALRRVDAVRVELDRIRSLLDNLEDRARQLRTAWLLGQAGSQRPSGGR